MDQGFTQTQEKAGLPGPEQVPASAVEIPPKKATFWQRLLAYILDGVILNLAAMLFGFACGLVSGLNGFIPLFYFFWLVYFAWPYSTGGQTIGKKILGIKVVSIDGSPLNWRKGIWRSLGYFPSSIFFDLGFLWSIWDQDKQAWHDKIAGTCVVSASTAREQLQGSIDPWEARRRQTRWRIGLGIPTLLILVLGISGFIFLRQRNTAEVRAMGPWPGPESSPEEIATVDLSHLGLELDEIKDARDEGIWAEGNYDEGKLITYKSGDLPIVAIWALRYENKQISAGDYQSLQASAEENCGIYSYADLGGVGIIRCTADNEYHKIFRNDEWLIHILAVGHDKSESEELVDKVRDLLANHWKGIEAP